LFKIEDIVHKNEQNEELSRKRLRNQLFIHVHSEETWSLE